MLRLFVGIWFQYYFTPLAGVLFTFLSRYLFTIGHKEYLVLPSGFGGFPQSFTYSVVLRISNKRCINFAYGTITPYGLSFQICSAINAFCNFSYTLPCIHVDPTTPILHERQPANSYPRSLQRKSHFKSFLHNIGLDYFLFARHY